MLRHEESYCTVKSPDLSECTYFSVAASTIVLLCLTVMFPLHRSELLVCIECG